MQKINFDYQKATQSLNFFANKYSGKKINKMKALKLVWIADRYHLRKYGRPVIGDGYVAMKLGPVASTVKDVAELSDFLDEDEKEYASRYLERDGEYSIKSKDDLDLEVFSDSDIESLEFAFREFGHLSQFDLSQVTHQYPEWKKHEPILNSGKSARVDMDYSDFFLDPDNLQNDKFELDDELLSESKETFLENSSIQEKL